MPSPHPLDAEVYELEFEEEGLEAGFTTVQNLLLLHFMPAAPANYVKVYLAGLMRCYGPAPPALGQGQGHPPR